MTNIHSKSSLKEHFLELIDHAKLHVTWKNFWRTKFIVVGLAGLQMMAVKAILIVMVAFGSLTQIAPLLSSAQLAETPGGGSSGGEFSAGGSSSGKSTAGESGTHGDGDTSGESIEGGSEGGTENGSTEGGKTDGGDTGGTPTCSEGQKRSCDTGMPGSCTQGSQVCSDTAWGLCTPTDTTDEICTDEIDNDCDGQIDLDDTDCVPGCTDPAACNYNPQATVSDGSCQSPQGCAERCPGDPGKPAQQDQCGQCLAPDDPAFDDCLDCAGIPDGDHIYDDCEQCLLPSDPNFNSCHDCAGIPNGDHIYDDCEQCLLPSDPNFNSCHDCAGVPDGAHITDQCGACLLTSDPDYNDCLDCLGDPYGTAIPESSCDDGNGATVNDLWSSSCNCVGQPATQDDCPADPEKTLPGICGCGQPDRDTDQDGSFDCQDACPTDPAKTDPGLCGCGSSDTDGDNDGLPDCQDTCPTDPTKTSPGSCGCGSSDVDTDGDEIPDCQDACPADPINQQCYDCAGVQYGSHLIDSCGSCLLPSDSNFNSCLDCKGLPDGPHLPGSSCDDQDTTTINDVRDSACVCQGEDVVTATVQPTDPTSPQTPTPTTRTSSPTVSYQPISSLPSTSSSQPSTNPLLDSTPPSQGLLPTRTKLHKIPVQKNQLMRLRRCLDTDQPVPTCISQTISGPARTQSVKVDQQPTDSRPNSCCTISPEELNLGSFSVEQQILLRHLQKQTCLIGSQEELDRIDTSLPVDTRTIYRRLARISLPADQIDDQHDELLPHLLSDAGINPPTRDISLPVSFSQSRELLLQLAQLHGTFAISATSRQPVTPLTEQPSPGLTALLQAISQLLPPDLSDLTCAERHRNTIKKLPVTAYQQSNYLTCRKKYSIPHCLHLYGIATNKRPSDAQSGIETCHHLLGIDHPDCQDLSLQLRTQSVKKFDCAQQESIPPDECDALLQLYSTTGGPDRNDASDWTRTPDPCSRRGIGCEQGHVHLIDLSQQGLRGSLTEIKGLPYLTYLDLSENFLGGPLPNIWLPRLKRLYLHDNQRVGTIPQQRSINLRELHTISLADNQICGTTKVPFTDRVASRLIDDNTQRPVCQAGDYCEVDTDCDRGTCNQANKCISSQYAPTFATQSIDQGSSRKYRACLRAIRQAEQFTPKRTARCLRYQP